jgi:nitrite reductase/ring-hydroxylating ferredoxin subunit
MNVHRLCPVEELQKEGRGFTLRHGADELRVFVIRDDDRVRAYLNRCPHTGVNLDWTPDRFLDWSGRMIQCATHGALFRLADGFCIAGPCAGRSLTPLTLRETDGYIEVLPP